MGEPEGVAVAPGGLEGDDLETSRIRETLHRIGSALTAELDVEKVVQRLIDEATALCRAQFGAFFYTQTTPEGGSLVLYTLSGAPREAFAKFPIPRQTQLFGPIFRGEGVVRSDDITKDPRYGHNPPYHGMPKGHLPVRSYLSVPVISRSGEVLGGLFFGHGECGVFSELDERLILSVAAQAAIAIDNARLYEAARNAEVAARRSEERFRSLVAATTQMVWTTDPLGSAVEDSPSWRAFTGQAYEELKEGGWLQALHPEDRERVRQEASRSVAAAAPYELEYRVRRHDGAYRVTRARAVPVLNDDGTVREWVVTNEDVTEARFAEQALQLLAEASRLFVGSLDFEETLQSVTRLVVPRFADACFADLAEDGAIRRIAWSHREQGGVQPPSPLGLAEGSGMPATGELSEALRAGRSELVTALPPRADEEGAHLRQMRDAALCSYLAAPLKVSGQVVGALYFGRADKERPLGPPELRLAEELAHRAALALANARLFREAKAAVGIRDDFLSIAGHELRTPLSALQLQIQGLRRQAKRDALGGASGKLVERMEKAGAHITRLEKLIGELLDVSRIVAGRLTIEREKMELSELVAEVTERFGEQLARSGSTLRLDAPHRVSGSWDRMRLDQVVSNLVGNAIKYGAGRPIEVSVGANGPCARLEVRDHGIGIAPEDQARVLGRFERAVSDRNYGGLGLGLWIVQKVVEAMNGSIHFQSAPGEGTTFMVDLPLGPAAGGAR